MFRLALSSHIYFLLFETLIVTLWSPIVHRNTWCGNACFGAQVSSKYGTWYSEGVILQFMCVDSWAGDTYLRYTVLTSPKKDETAVHCCDPALSFLFMLVSRNVFHVVSAMQSIVFTNWKPAVSVFTLLSNWSYLGDVTSLGVLSGARVIIWLDSKIFETCNGNFP